MFRPFELFIGLRYTRAKRRNHFISFISGTSILGIALGVTALITILSVMNGFQTELRQRILGMTAHVTIGEYGRPLKGWRQVQSLMLEQREVEGVAPYIQAEGMLMASGQVHGSVIRGVLPDEEPNVSEVGEKMILGSLNDLHPAQFGIILGRDLANALGVTMGDKVTLVTPMANVSPAGVLPRLKRFTVVGVFQVGMYEYDSALAVIHLNDAQRLFRMDDGVSGVRLKIKDLYRAPLVSRELGNLLPGFVQVSDWTRQHANFFRAVQIEKRVMFIILLLIVAVAAFNIVSTLVMTVTDKESDIAILRTLGATPRSIMGVFIVLGTLIGLVGTALGLVGGVALALNVEAAISFLERIVGFDLFPADVYYISRLPSELHWSDVTAICTISFLLSIVATIYPAWRAARTQPAEALRYD